MKFKFVFKSILIITTMSVAIACNSGGKNNEGIISVSGIGTVVAPPDTVQIYLYFKNVSETAEEAKKAVGESVQKVLDILKTENITNNNIQTLSLSYGTENEYRDGRVVYAGQRAEQNIVIMIDDIINSPEKLPIILDKLVGISNTSVNNIQFSVKDKTEFFKQSRELAIQKALEKAEQYAGLSGKKITGVQNINESNGRDARIVQAKKNTASVSADYDSGYSNIPAGEQEITTEIRVEYKIK